MTDSDDNADWYDLQGRKLNAKPTRRGVYVRSSAKGVMKVEKK